MESTETVAEQGYRPQILRPARMMIEGLKEGARRVGRGLRRTGKKSRTLVRLYEEASGQRRRARFELARLRSRLAGNPGARAGGSAVRPENMVWIFGSGRSGSTWLRSMMAEADGVRVWEEPMVGRLFGEFYARSPRDNKRSADFIMGEPIRKGWVRSVRLFVLDGAAYSNPGLRPDERLVVKEPNGSVGAALLMEALPESRMVLLVRDPRDVVASVLDAAGEGGWLHESRRDAAAKARGKAARKPVAFAAMRARAYRRGVESARKAYDGHRGPKVLIRYEDLLADTVGSLRRIYSGLSIPVGEEELVRVAEMHSWKNVPAGEKGRGKFYRKGRPGGWKDDLTPRQVEAVERITASLIDRFYPGSRAP